MTNTTTNQAPTYNVKVVNRIDRVMLVLAVIVSAFIIFAGAHAHQEANATSSGASSTFTVKPGTLDAYMNIGNGSNGLGGSLAPVAPPTSADYSASVNSEGGTLTP